jgi:hypothetical protein
MPQNQQSIGLYWFTREHEKSTQLRFRRDLGHSGIRLDKVLSNVDAVTYQVALEGSPRAGRKPGEMGQGIGIRRAGRRPVRI